MTKEINYIEIQLLKYFLNPKKQICHIILHVLP